jgi:hypothetical protein
MDFLTEMSKKPKSDSERLKEALDGLPDDTLEGMLESGFKDPPTPHMDEFQDRMSAADQAGRDLAHQYGPELVKTALGLGGVGTALAGNAALRRGLIGAGIGGVGGAIAGGKEHRIGGAFLGAAGGGAAGAASGAIGSRVAARGTAQAAPSGPKVLSSGPALGTAQTGKATVPGKVHPNVASAAQTRVMSQPVTPPPTVQKGMAFGTSPSQGITQHMGGAATEWSEHLKTMSPEQQQLWFKNVQDISGGNPLILHDLKSQGVDLGHLARGVYGRQTAIPQGGVTKIAAKYMSDEDFHKLSMRLYFHYGDRVGLIKTALIGPTGLSLGRKLVGAAVRSPKAATGIAAAGLAGITSKPENRTRNMALAGGMGFMGGNALRKGLLGTAAKPGWMGKGVGNYMGGASIDYAKSTFGQRTMDALRTQFGAQKTGPRKSNWISGLPAAEPGIKSASLIKIALMCSAGPDGSDSWLGQFEGTPFFQKAIELERQALQMDMEDSQRRQEEDAEFDSRHQQNQERWRQRDMLGIERRRLQLELAENKASGVEDPASKGGGLGSTTAGVPDEYAPNSQHPSAEAGGSQDMGNLGSGMMKLAALKKKKSVSKKKLAMSRPPMKLNFTPAGMGEVAHDVWTSARRLPSLVSKRPPPIPVSARRAATGMEHVMTSAPRPGVIGYRPQDLGIGRGP